MCVCKDPQISKSTDRLVPGSSYKNFFWKVNQGLNRVFFLDAPRKTGKMSLINLIVSSEQVEGPIHSVVCMELVIH